MRTRLRRLLFWIRPRVPVVLVPVVARFWQWQSQRDPQQVQAARLHMEFLLGKTRPGVDLDEAVRRYQRRMALRTEMRWHPSMVMGQRVEGIENLRDRSGGVIVTFLHHGSYDGALPSIAAAGAAMHVVADPNHFRADAEPWSKRHIALVGRGGHTFGADEGTDGIVRRLRDGAAVAIALDVPGRTPVTFAGHDVLGSFGAARIAHTFGFPVVTLTVHEGADAAPVIRLGAPVDPAQFGSPADLLAHLLRRHEAAAVAWPEVYDRPSTRWGVVPVNAAGGGQ